MSFTEWSNNKKKKKEEETSKSAAYEAPSKNTGNTVSSFSDWSNKKKESTASTSVQDWVQSSQNLLEEVQRHYSSWQNDDSQYTRFQDRASTLLAFADGWRKQYSGNDEAIKSINSVVSSLSSMKQYAMKYKDYYSKWDSEDAYKQAVEQHKASEKARAEMLSFDLEAGQKEIDELEDLLREYDRLVLTYDTTDLNAESNVRLRELRSQYSRKEIKARNKEIKAMLSEKKAYFNQAKHLQETTKMSSVNDPDAENYDPEFSKYTEYAGSTWIDNGLKRFFSWDETAVMRSGYEDIRYDFINDPDAIQNVLANSTNNADLQLLSGLQVYRNMTDEQVSIYNYYYAKDGKEAADKYLGSIQETLNHQEALEVFEPIEDKVLLELAFGVAAGVEQFGSGVRNLFNTKDDYIPQSVTQIASGMVREDLADDSIPMWYNFNTGQWEDKILGNSLGQVGYDAITTTANMLPSIIASAAISYINPVAGQIVGSSLMGASAAGNAYQEMLNLGYDKGQARWYSTLVGASEAGLQYLLGGIGKMGGKLSGAAITKLLDGVDNAFARIAIQLGGNMASEGIEEGLQEVLTPWFKKMALHIDEDINWSEVAYSTLLGSLTSLFMEGGETVTGEVAQQAQYYKTGKTIKQADGGEAALKKLADDVYGVTSADMQKKLGKQMDKVNKKATSTRLGKLYDTVQTANNQANASANQADIAKSLERKGFGYGQAKDIAEALVASYNGQELTRSQSKLLKSVKDSKVVQDAISNIMDNTKSTMGQRSQNIRDFQSGVYKDLINNEVKKIVRQNTTAKQFTPTGEYEVADNGKAINTETNEEIEIKGVASVRKGELLLDIGDGKTVNVKSVSFASDSDALIYESIAKLGDNISAEAANKLIAKYDGSNAAVFARGIAQAYTYGFYGIDSSELAGKHSLATELTTEQRNFAYGLGEQYRPVKDRADKAKARAMKAPGEKGVYYRDKDGNATDIRSYLKKDGRVLNEMQTTGIEFMEKMSKMMGVRFNVFETWVENGTRYYLDENGEKTEGNPNGFYDPKTGEIYIDLFAGNDFQGTMLFTVAHELTHFMRQWSPEHFTKISKLVFSHAGFKGSVSSLVADKMNTKRKLSYDAALEEVVADGMETILKDGKVAEFMADVKKTDSKVWAKLKEWFQNFAEFLKKMVGAYSGQSAQTVEGQKVADFSKKLLNQIEQIWAEGAVSAGENYQEAVDSFRAAQDQFSTDSIRGNADGAVIQNESTEALTHLESPRTEYEALPKQVMSLSDGAGTILDFIEGLVPSKIRGLADRVINGYTGRDVRGYAMGVSGFTKAQINEVNKFMDTMADFMKEAGVTYRFIGLQDVENAQLHYTYNADGSIKSIVLSAMVKNGDYPVNFDLSSICKKRVAMSQLIDKLARRGSLDSGTVKLTPSNIFKINTALKNAGYETACLGCFVESKRYNSLEWAKKFCDKWNAAVKKVNHNATYFGYGDASFNEDSFTLEQAIKIDQAATKYIKATKTERLANALAKYKAREQEGLPLVTGKVMKVDGVELNTFSKAARERLAKSDTISDELKTKYLTCDVATLNMADVEFLLENGILPGAALTNKQAVTEMVKSGEAYQHLLRPSDLLTDRGISKLEALPNFHGVLYGHYGSGTPKLMQSYTPYNSEIALLPASKGEQSLAEYLYTIAGVRMQSFSDFQIQNIYDYLQMVADLAARKVPAHAYTKEISFAKLLGMTGIKVNLSVMFDIDPMVDKAHAGLTKLNKLVHRGEYAKVVLEDEHGKWVYNIGDYQTQKLFAEAYPDEAKRFLQSIGFGDAVKLQSSPGYSSNCGIIGVGYSDLGIFAMLNDNRIRYIIPYHASSLPAEIKLATHIALGTDYTPYQNNMKIKEIVDRNGKKVNWTIKEAYKRLGSGQAVINELNDNIRTEGWVVTTSKAQTGHGTYKLYEDLQQTNDPRKTASNFMDWCIGNSTLPLFYQFASHENYYKLIYDYNVYDCVTEEYAPQQAVTNTYPTMVDGQVQPGNVTDGGFDAEYLKGTIDKQMAFMDEYSRNLDEDLEQMADNLESGTLFSFRGKNKDGIEVYETSEATMNLTWADRVSQYEKMLSTDFVGRTARFERNGHIYYAQFDPDSAGKVLYGEKGMSKAGKKAIIRAGSDGDIFDLVENARYDHSAKDTKNHKAKDGFTDYFDYFYKTVQIDGKVFDININVKKQYGSKHGYTYTIKVADNKTMKASPALAGTQPSKVQGTPSGTKIAQPAPIVNNNNSTLHSDRDNAPTFYSQMAKVVDGVKQEKLGAASVVSMLRGKGVKAEEIKWSGIEAWLEGKKSVTKAELQEFIAGSMLQIGEQTSSGTSAARWSKYKLDGGENYREIVFTLPNSSYSNQMMRLHWGEDAEGVLAHARTQDMNTFIGRMLFIEEIQSDWHNEGHAKGYESAEYKEAERVADELFNEYQKMRRPFNKYVRSSEFNTDPEDVRKKKFDWLRSKMETAEKKWKEAERYVESLLEKGSGNVPDAPFRDTYHEYVMKRLLRMAAEEGYDSIGWTPAQIQVERWSEKFSEGYRIEYDQDIPKFLNKYGKKWGTKVGKTVLDNGTEVWSMAITDSMKESVLTEGQPLYSDRDSDGNQLSQGQQVFFKDSKIRDANGNLLKVFHGTPKKFTTFRQGTAEGWGQGIYFTDNIEAAKEFGENIVEAYLNITNPFNVDTMNYNDIDFESTKAYQNFDKKYWQRWYDEYDTYEEYRDDGMGVDIDMIYTEYVDVFNQILRELGYDGIVANQSNNIDGYEIVAFHENQPKLTSNTNPTTSDDLRFQDRSDDSVSNRSLLANAFDGIAKPAEKQKLQEYKDKIDLINAEEKKLRELNAEIKELSFAKGPKDTKRLKALRFDANQAANRINTYDKQLLRLEASQPLQDVLAREKKRAYAKAAQRGREALAEYKAKVEAQQKETAEKWRESRKTAVAKARETAEKRDARDKLQKLVLDTVKWITYPAKTDVKCPDILKKPYEAFLQGIDLSSKRLANGGEATKNDLRLANAMDSLATAIDRVMLSQDPSQEVDKVLDIGYLDLPADFVQKLRDMTESIKSMMVEGEYVVNTMTAAEVRKLSQMIRTLNHAIKTMSKLYANLRFANVEALGFDTMDFLDAIGEIEKTGGMKDFAQWDNALPYYAFKRFGKGGESIFEGLMDAQDKLAFLAQDIFAFQEKTWTGKEAKAWSEDTHTIDLPNGNKLTLTTADAMSIYCLSRREHALPHLLGGGIRVTGIQKGSKKAKDSRSLLTIQDVDAIISSLTDRQKQVAEGIQEFMSTVCSEWGNEISMKRFLTREFNEKFYFPIESNDENLTVKDPAAQQSDLFRLLNISATKPLTQGANNEVIIRNIFDVFTGHASDMARLNAYGMGLLDYMKWLNYRERGVNEEGQINVKGVRKSMEKAFGKAANSYVLNLIKDVNGRASDGGDPTILMKWMRAAKTASVGNSLRVATLQFTSYPRAALVLSPQSLALGLTKIPNIKRAKKYCGIALWKSFGFYDTNISRSIEDQMKGVKDIKQKLIELSLLGAEWGDAITWGCLWNACEYEVAKTTTNKVGSEEFYQEVGKKLREVVYRTQVVDSTLTRSQIMRSKRGMAQEATAFMSEPTLSANILMDAGFEFALEKRRTGSVKTAWKMTGSYVGRAIAVYTIGQVTAALLEAFWDAWRDDDDEEFKKKYLSAFVTNLALDILPLNKLPIISGVADAALAIFDIGYFSADSMYSAWLTQTVSAVGAWKKVFSGESSTTVYNALYKSARAVSSMLGISISGVMREGVALWNNTAGAYDTTLKIRQYDLSKADLGSELYDAIISGDTRQADSLKAQFDDQDALSSAIRTALRENDPRIREAAEAQINGDPSERVRIAKRIIADGFSQDDVVRAINSEINDMTPSDSESTAKKKGFYTAEDFAIEIANGDKASAAAAKEDIIQTAQSNGKDEDAAEQSFINSAKTKLKELYVAGNLSESKAVDALKTYCQDDDDPMDDNDIYWLLKEWKYEKETGSADGYGKYNDFHNAVKTGKNLRAVIADYTGHGVTAKTLASQITTYFKPLYKKMSNYERADLKGYLLNAYAMLGYNRNEKSKDIDKWLKD